jgi:hypothetical protein
MTFAPSTTRATSSAELASPSTQRMSGLSGCAERETHTSSCSPVSSARCQTGKVLGDDYAQLDFFAVTALRERDRSAGAQREQTSPDRIPARDEVIRARELGRTEREQARSSQQDKSTALRAPARANAATR